MFFRRGVSDDDRFLQAKLWIFGAGAVLALLGMGLQSDWLIGVAGLVLASGLVLRFIGRRGSEAREEDGTGEEGHEGPGGGAGRTADAPGRSGGGPGTAAS